MIYKTLHIKLKRISLKAGVNLGTPEGLRGDSFNPPCA